MRSEIILSGPMACGKTTVGKALSAVTKLPHLNLDYIKWDYFTYHGYSNEKAEQEYNKDGIRGLHKYYKIFEINTLEKIFSEYKNCIFDLGAGFLFYDNIEQQKKVTTLLSKFYNKFILLPHADFKKSYDILQKRFSKRFNHDSALEKIINSSKDFNLNHIFLKSYYENKNSCNMIYTFKKDLKTIATEIIKKSVYD